MTCVALAPDFALQQEASLSTAVPATVSSCRSKVSRRHARVETPSRQAAARTRFNEMLTQIYPQLRRMAAARFITRGTSPTSLAQETICRLIALPTPPDEADAALAMSFKIMEWTSIDNFRSRESRQSRELAAAMAGQRRTDAAALSPQWTSMLEHLSGSIAVLAERKPRAIEILVLTSICRMTQGAIADLLGICLRTVRDDLRFAKAFIAAQVKIRMGGCPA